PRAARNRFGRNFRGWRLDEFSIFGGGPARAIAAGPPPPSSRDIDADLTIGFDIAGSIARQTAGLGKLTPIVHGWHPVMRGERDKLLDVVAIEGVGAEQ